MKNSNVQKIAEKLQLRTVNVDGTYFIKHPHEGTAVSVNSSLIIYLMQSELITAGYKIVLNQNETTASNDTEHVTINKRYNDDGMALLYIELMGLK